MTRHSWVIDLDGVVWLGGRPIPGSVDAVNRLIERGDHVAFVTNSSWYRIAEQESHLAAIGIDPTGRVITSAQAAATCCEPGERAAVLGGPGLLEALQARGVTAITLASASAGEVDGVDVVVAGIDRHLTYASLATAASLIRDGARFVLSNGDPTYPTAAGLEPGAGTIGAALTAASGVTPIVAGKPSPPMVALVRHRLGPDGTVVGDRPDTDGLFARALGYRFALVLSGVTGPADLPVEPAPDSVSPSLADAVGDNAHFGGDAG